MKKTAVLVLLLALAGVCHAQFLGYVSSQTVSPLQVFTNQGANSASAILQNIGQSAHFLSYCNTAFRGTISLEASPDGTFSSPNVIASATYGQQGITDSACHVLQAGGYYQTVRARVSNYLAGTVNAWYTAIASPITFTPAGIGSNGPTAPPICDQFVFFTLPPSTLEALVTPLVGAQIYVCYMAVSFNGATTAGQIQFGSSLTGGGCPSFVANWDMAVTANTPQFFTLGAPLGAFLQEGPGTQLCANSGANTATAAISMSFSQR